MPSLGGARSRLAALMAVGLVAGLAVSASAYPRPGSLELVSISAEGTSANDSALATSISADGRLVAMQSRATTLVPGHGGDRLGEIFVRDRTSGVVESVTVAEDGSAPDESSFGGTLTPDGRFITFTSRATNLVPTDTTDLPWNGREQVYVRDLPAGVTERVSVGTEGEDGNANSRGSSITPDGRFVAFASDASNLVEGDTNDIRDVFVRDRLLGVTERVSLGWEGQQSDGWSETPSISADGTVVAFESLATNLVPTEMRLDTHIYVRDLARETTELISVSLDGETPNRYSGNPMLSADGRFVAFWSMASNLVPGDLAQCRWPDSAPPPPLPPIPVWVNCTDAFVFDRLTRTTERVSVTSEGLEADGESYPSWISPDGRWVGFDSSARSLSGKPTDDARTDAYLHDRWTGVTEHLSVTPQGEPGDGYSAWPVASHDLRFVAFSTNAPNLHPEIHDGLAQAVVRDRGPELGIGELTAAAEGGSIRASGWATAGARVIAKSVDPPADALPGSSEVGTELMGARVSLRPEQEDLLLRLDAVRIPAIHPERPVQGLTVLPGTAAAPGVVWGASFELGGVRHEVRADREASPSFGLYRCAAMCEEVSALQGAIGTVGHAVVVSVPLEALGVTADTTLTAVRAFSGLGTRATGLALEMDRVDLSPLRISLPRLEIGLAPAGTPESHVSYTVPAGLQDGWFDASIQPAAPGPHDIWARLCLGEECDSTATKIT